MIPGKRYTPEDVLRIGLRYKWLVAAPLVLALIAVVPVLHMLPDKYRSQTLILVVPQRVPESYVRSTVTTRVEDRLESLRQQILSRTRLERIINDLDLYGDLRKTAVMEDVVDYMRRLVTVQMVRGDAFTVSFVSQDPVVAQKVTEQLASLVIEENMRDREVLAEATNQFLDTQLENARARLIEHEKKLETYRREHSGELPSQVEANMQALQTLQVQVQGLSDSVTRDRDRLFAIDRDLKELPAKVAAGVVSGSAPGTPVDEDGLPIGSAAVRLAAARQSLRVLKTRLTPEHPDVIRMTRIISDLETKAAEERKAAAAASAEAPEPAATDDGSTRETELRDERTTLARQIETKDQQLAALRQKIADYQARLDAAPTRESEMTELMRDYGTLQKVYTDLLAKREDSKVAANLERRQIGEQFRVLDPANRPERPFSPNRPLIAAAAAGLGLACGLGLVVLLEVRDRTLRTDADVAQALKLPVLAMIPRMPNAAERRDRRRRTMLAFGAAAVTLTVAAVMAFSLLR